MKKILVIVFYIFTFQSFFSQTDTDCVILDGLIDTVSCDNEQLIVELSFCQESNLYQDGVVTDLHGNEKFYFIYKYSKNLQLKKIVIWTFKWNNGGFETLDKIGVLKIKEGKNKLSIKRGYSLDKLFLSSIIKLQ